MSLDTLRVVTFCAYLAAWLVVAVAALWSAIPRMSRQETTPVELNLPLIVGTTLQALGILITTASLGDGPLRPAPAELLGALPLAPIGAAVFVWALRSAPTHSSALATTGAYRLLRHPIYLAFLALLISTALLASAGLLLLPAVALYLAGSELRIASEEAALTQKFPETYPAYRRQTPYRYLPGLR